MAAHQPGVWGIDLGQCALKAIRLEMKDGEVVVTAFEYIEHPKILSQPDADPDEMTREALTQFLAQNKTRGDLIAISVPGQSGLARFVKLPPVDQKKVADIVKFEAKQQIPFPLEEVVWDYQALSTGEIVDGMALETEIGLFAIKRDMVNRAIQQFKEVNVEVHLVQMAPLSLCNLISYDLLGKDTSTTSDMDEDHSCIVALEIGTDSSNLVITDGGRIIWQRPIPIGGNHFTRALTKELKLTFAKAEHLKRNAAKSADLKKILQALKQVLNDFVGEVQRSLGYFTNTHRNAQIQYMVGLGNAFRLPGLQKFLQEKLQLEVRKFTGPERATGDSVTSAPTFAENVMSFGVAYGLGLQGLKQARLQTNLLPHEVRLERIVRGKKPWAVLAAASLLLGMCLLQFSRHIEISNASNDLSTTEAKKLTQLLAVAQKKNEEYAAKDAELSNRLKNLDKIGAGVKERFNWPLLHQFVNFVTPQPNGEKLVDKAGLDPVRVPYWEKNPNAQKAFEMLERQRLGIVDNLPPVELQKQEVFMKQHLIQINIAGINAMYSEDLVPYFKKLYTDGEQLQGMSAGEQASVRALNADPSPTPEKLKELGIPKEGWVVEIRGYTYREKSERFILATLVENLKNPRKLKNAAGKPYNLPEGMKEFVEDRVGFINLYKTDTVKEPVAGEFKLINRGYLRQLIKGNAPLVGPGGPGLPPPNAMPGQAPVGEKPSRELWKPLGETAAVILTDAPIAVGGGGLGGGGFPQPPPPVLDPKGAPAPPTVVPRTEFVLVFVWREYLSSQQALSATPGLIPPPQ